MKIRASRSSCWVAERIASVAPKFDLWFAVDDPLLADCLAPGGFRTVMTRVDHASGTDRIAEANRTVRADLVINVQADEPMVSAGQIGSSPSSISGPADMATLATRFRTPRTSATRTRSRWSATRRAGRCISPGRRSLPARPGRRPDDAWVAANPCFRHLGLYAYKARLLEDFAGLPVGRLEAIERLEQLRVIENGREIAVGLTDDPSIGVDTPEDAGKFEEHLRREAR
jgi:3-deoxy-manno-octulosonate cytidylyltransferase (CMP-KDO synthetase)